MSRSKHLINWVLVVVGFVALIALFIGFRHDAALVGALSAAGAVAAAAFAAVAALGSMRAAAESSVTAKRAREAVARSVRPQLQPSVVREDGKLLGKVQCGEGRSAIDVTVAWMLANDETITDQVARLEPSRADRPADTANSLVVDLNLPDATNEWEGIKMVWIEYWDASRVGHWQDTWLLGTEPHDQGRLQQTESRLVD